MILAEDEASLCLQATVARVWAPRGQAPVIRLDQQRDKTSFYGTLNLATGSEIVTQASSMSAATTIQHLEQILAAYPKCNILLLWDRAPWHKARQVQEFLAAHPRLEVVNFPVAAPDLNPQEHVWKATRNAVSHNHGRRRLPELADQFAAHLSSQTFHSSFLDRYGFTAIRAMFT